MSAWSRGEKHAAPETSDGRGGSTGPSMAADTVWMICGYALRMALQAGYFLMLANALGASAYGAFVSTVVVLGFVGPFAGLGIGHILVRDAAIQSDDFRAAAGDALGTVFIGGGLLCLGALPLVAIVAPDEIPLATLALLVLADGLGVPLTEVCAQAFQASRSIRYSAVLQFTPGLFRLTAVVWFSSLATPALSTWLTVYAIAGLLSAALALASVLRIARPSPFQPRRALVRIRAGWPFSVMVSAQSLHNDIDKTLLARMSTLEAAGTYSAAYRLVDVAFAPVRALMYSAYARFFSTGAQGAMASLQFAAKLARAALLYTLPVTLTIFLCAGLVPTVLGESFRPSVEALRWLALLLPLRALSSVLGDTLLSTGRFFVRMMCSVGVVALNAALNLVLIEAFSWRGALIATVTSEVALLVAFCCFVFWLRPPDLRGSRSRSHAEVG